MRTRVPGPDQVSPRALRVCAEQLCDVPQFIFSLSLSQSKIPVRWKTSCIVPVPKKPNSRDLMDFRPIALTSQLIKCFERVVLEHLNRQVCAYQDPLQFTYRRGVGVDDALLYMLHRV